MPPKGKLKDREIEVLSRWVAMGLPWPETKPAAPAAADASSSTRAVESGRSSGHSSRSRPSPCRLCVIVHKLILPSTAFSWRTSKSMG